MIQLAYGFHMSFFLPLRRATVLAPSGLPEALSPLSFPSFAQKGKQLFDTRPIDQAPMCSLHDLVAYHQVLVRGRHTHLLARMQAR